MKPRLIILGLLFAVMFWASLSYSGVPQMINYQGKLTTPGGALIDSTLSMVFSIYDNLADVSPAWAETLMVQVEKGIFSVVLGNVHPLPNDLFDGTVQYLGVKAGTDPEMTPRKEIVSVAYAFKSLGADTASYAHAGPGVADNDWNFRITDTADTTLMTGGEWGIARAGNVLYGNKDSTHVNLGVACTTGTNGQNYYYCTVAGGKRNVAANVYATVGGGLYNKATSSCGVAAGGQSNTASGTHQSTVGGGYKNNASSNYSTVAGGYADTASANYATVGGGEINTASGYYSTIGGGSYNTASSSDATVGGGYQNDASGYQSTVPGGLQNTAAGNLSFAAGYRAKANHDGAFVWADYTFGATFASTDTNQFLIRASGGVGIGTNSPQGALDVSSTTGAFIVPRMTTAQRDALSAVNGMIIYNTTTNQFNFYENGAWVTK